MIHGLSDGIKTSLEKIFYILYKKYFVPNLWILLLIYIPIPVLIDVIYSTF